VDDAREARRLVVNLMAADISTGFETDLGYLGRAGISRIGGAVSPRFYPRGVKHLRRVETGLQTERTYDRFDNIRESSNTASLTPRAGGVSDSGSCG
jgi:hypothetical protein